MLTVIFGAGASYDSIPDDPPTPGRITHGRPPLATELFSHRFGEAIDRYPACRPLIHHLRTLPADASIEDELDRLTQDAEAASDLRLRRQLAAIRYYLADVILNCTNAWSQTFHGMTTYSVLADRLSAWATRVNEQVLWVNFNYDTLFEQGLKDVTGFRPRALADYVTQLDRHFVVKPHGSVNWIHLTEDPDPNFNYNGSGSWIAEQIIDRLPYVSIGKGFVLGGWMVTLEHNKGAIPAITIPIRQKAAFECPQDQLEMLERGLSETSRVLVIGWAANEENFLRLCRENLKGRFRVQIVCGGAKQSNDTSRMLQSRMIRGEHFTSEKGFSGFLASNEMAWLLQEDLSLSAPRPL